MAARNPDEECPRTRGSSPAAEGRLRAKRASRGRVISVAMRPPLVAIGTSLLQTDSTDVFTPDTGQDRRAETATPGASIS